MRILQVCNKVPYPANDGGAIATLNFTTSFTELGHEVTVIAMSTTKHPIQLSDLSDELKQTVDWEIVPIHNPVNVFDALKAVMNNKSYNVERFNQKEFNNALVKLLHRKRFDIIQLEGIFLCPYIKTIREFHKGKIALRTHNVEFEIWERLANQAINPIKKTYLKLLAIQLKKYEKSVFEQVDLIVPITKRDQRLIQQFHPKSICHTAPVGINIQAETNASNKQNIFFIGSLDWTPNIEGIQWFLKKVWPLLDASIELNIAGRNTPENMYKMASGRIHILGEVEDAKEYMKENGLMIVPLLSGSGMRVKIIEGMALSKCIITTSIGAEGIPYTEGKNILIADTPKAFAESINKYYQDIDKQIKIGQQAYQLISDKFSNRSVSQQLINFYQEHSE